MLHLSLLWSFASGTAQGTDPVFFRLCDKYSAIPTSVSVRRITYIGLFGSNPKKAASEPFRPESPDSRSCYEPALAILDVGPASSRPSSTRTDSPRSRRAWVGERGALYISECSGRSERKEPTR